MSERDAITAPARLMAIAELGLLKKERSPQVQAIVDEAASALALPTALVSVVLDDAQFFYAAHGLDGWLAKARGTPIEWSFCANVVRDGAPFVVDDATRNERVSTNPLVVRDGVRCYAGVPLVTAGGAILGAMCVLGPEARTFSGDELALLRKLADDVVREIGDVNPPHP